VTERVADALAKLAEKQAKLAAARPLAAASMAVLDAWFDVEQTWSSNALEGNTLTRQETALVIDKGLTIGGKPLKDHLEAVDHATALAWVRALAQTDEPLREMDVRQLHALVVARSLPEEPGGYAQVQRFVRGSQSQFPSPAEVPASMGDFAAQLHATPASPGWAFDAHYRLVSIHPFADGNGRTARLLMNLILLRAGYPILVITPDHRAAYLDLLEGRRLQGEDGAYTKFMAARLDASLDRYLEAAAKG